MTWFELFGFPTYIIIKVQTLMTGLISNKSKPVRIFLAPEELTVPVLHKYNIFLRGVLKLWVTGYNSVN